MWPGGFRRPSAAHAFISFLFYVQSALKNFLFYRSFVHNIETAVLLLLRLLKADGEFTSRGQHNKK